MRQLDVDVTLASRVMAVAKFYGDPPDIFTKLSWNEARKSSPARKLAYRRSVKLAAGSRPADRDRRINSRHSY